MTKYFDLLKAHQQNKRQQKSSPPEGAVDSKQNPYAQQETQAAPDVTLSEDNELIDEAWLDTDDDNATQAIDTTTLPSEEEAPQPSAFASEVAPQGDSASLDTNKFSPGSWLQQLSNILQHIFHDAQHERPTDIFRLSAPLQLLLDQLHQDHKVLDTLELEASRNLKKIYPSDSTVNDLVEKSIMMMLYAIRVCLRLKATPDDMIQHTMAAMLHHIGMAMVPEAIRQKTNKLNDKEMAMIREAPQKAVAYLKSCGVTQDNILLAAEQAAERYDGSGPQGLSGHDIAWIARLVGLLSMFEALTHMRPYRQRLLPRDAIRELVNWHKKAFDPALLKALIEAVSLYPVGLFVQLNTGEIGQVIQVHNQFPLRPVVYVHLDKHGKPISPREINLKQQPNLMIQKSMYQDTLQQA